MGVLREICRGGRPAEARADPGQRDRRRPAMRRLGRHVRHHRQSGAWRRCRYSGRRPAAPASCRKPRRSMAPSICSPRARQRRKSPKSSIGLIKWWEDACRQARRLDRQQPLARQQARRPDHHSGKVAGRGRQGRPDAADGRLRLCRKGDRARPRLHGYARLRPGLGDRPGGRRRQCHRLHHRPRLLLRLPPDAVDQGRQQLDALPRDGRGHGRRLRRHRLGRQDDRAAWAARSSN